ncbi:MAG TPA: DinB family protein [Rhodothermales bacterium]|nr:DinB family protein [Rhodothermales bacterium]
MDNTLADPWKTYVQGFEALKEEASVLVDGLDEAAFNWRHDPESWSVGECLDHLNTLGTLSLPKWDEALKKGKGNNQTGTPPFDYGFLGRWWISAMQPSSRRRFKTPKVFEPSSSELDCQQVISTFLDLQDQFIKRVEASRGLDLRRVKAPSAAFSLLRLPLGAWFESTIAHEERHLAQARRVMHHVEFPMPEDKS